MNTTPSTTNTVPSMISLFDPLRSWPKDKKAWAAFFFALMLTGASIYVFFFPLGRAFQEGGSIIAFCSLVVYLILDYPSSNFKKYRLKWIFALFCGLLVFKTLHSMDPIKSIGGLERCTYHGLLLFFVGLELMRSRRHIALFVALFTIMTVYEGLDGVFQFVTKKDFFFGTPIDGIRLTGSFSTPRVGNLMALALPIVFALPTILPKSWSPIRRVIFTIAIMIPGVFLLLGSQTRTGYIALAAAGLVLLFHFIGLKRSLALSAILIVSAGIFMAKTESRLSLKAFRTDPRWEIWNDHIRVFKIYPLLGSGIYTSREIKRRHGIGLNRGEYSDISHPHNSYVQFLAETGITGLLVFIAFLGSHGFSLSRRLSFFKKEHSPLELPLLAFFCSYLAYCVASLSAHNFYEGWWLGLPMLILGMAMGIAQIDASVNGPTTTQTAGIT